MANTLKGKTLTTWTIILPNENVAKKFMESVSGHFEFMQTRSFQNGPLKLIQYVISSGPEWQENNSFLEGKMRKLAELQWHCLKFMRQRMVCITTGLNLRIYSYLLKNGLKRLGEKSLSIPIKKLCRVYGTNHDREAVTGVYHRRN